MPFDPDLSPEEEAALDRAWGYLQKHPLPRDPEDEAEAVAAGKPPTRPRRPQAEEEKAAGTEPSARQPPDTKERRDP